MKEYRAFYVELGKAEIYETSVTAISMEEAWVYVRQDLDVCYLILKIEEV